MFHYALLFLQFVLLVCFLFHSFNEVYGSFYDNDKYCKSYCCTNSINCQNINERDDIIRYDDANSGQVTPFLFFYDIQRMMAGKLSEDLVILILIRSKEFVIGISITKWRRLSMLPRGQ
jgi:hypothetical protein